MHFISLHRSEFGVEPICRVLQFAPSNYYLALKKQRGLKPSRRSQSYDFLAAQIRKTHSDNFSVYGVRKICRHLQSVQGIQVARCTVERLMRRLGLKGVVRGRKVFTTQADVAGVKRPDLVNRNFTASKPDELWRADFTYVRTNQGFVYVAFILGVFSRRILGWKVARHMRTELVEAALGQAIARRGNVFGLVHHSDKASQYTSLAYSLKLVEAAILASMGSTGDSYVNAMAETIIGLYKAEVIQSRSSWTNLQDIEFVTQAWVYWFNNKRLYSSIGYKTPVQLEENYYALKLEQAMVA